MPVRRRADSEGDAAVKAIAHPAESEIPHVDIGVPELDVYDELITMAGSRVRVVAFFMER